VNNTAEELLHGDKSSPSACKAIDPCTMCAHGAYMNVDNRCESCELRGRKFLELIHISKKTA